MATHEQVAHAWANREDRHRTGYAMMHDVDTIFSWGSHFPVARHVVINGTRAVLITTRSCSVSTSTHIWEARRAIEGKCPVFPVDNVMSNDWSAHVDDLLAQRDVENQRAERARVNGEFRRRRAASLHELAKQLLRFMDGDEKSAA